MLDKVRQQISVVITDGYNDFIIGDNADGDGAERQILVLLVLHRDAQNGEQPISLRVRARAFVGIGNIIKK